MSKITIALLALSFMSLAVVATSAVAATDPRISYVKQQLISSGIDKAAVDKLFSDKRIKTFSFKSVSYKQPDWGAIERKLLGVILIQIGREYIRANENIFEGAEKDFGVDKEVLAGIIGIETSFGKNLGGYTTFNVLYSRVKQWSATKWKRQAAELVALSKYCLRANKDCFSIKGSYAGAIGLVQFIPSSLLAYGVDGDNNGIVDLSKASDAIPSAANFLKSHGWQKDKLAALARYYGSPVGYPQIVLDIASALKK